MDFAGFNGNCLVEWKNIRTFVVAKWLGIVLIYKTKTKKWQKS
jgi:hypothetical protein